MVLALTENKLTSLEKDPLIWLILREQVFGMENVSTSCQDCIPILEQTTSSWDTVYLDPMFHSVRQKAFLHWNCSTLGLCFLRLVRMLVI